MLSLRRFCCASLFHDSVRTHGGAKHDVAIIVDEMSDATELGRRRLSSPRGNQHHGCHSRSASRVAPTIVGCALRSFSIPGE